MRHSFASRLWLPFTVLLSLSLTLSSLAAAPMPTPRNGPTALALLASGGLFPMADMPGSLIQEVHRPGDARRTSAPVGGAPWPTVGDVSCLVVADTFPLEDTWLNDRTYAVG